MAQYQVLLPSVTKYIQLYICSVYQLLFLQFGNEQLNNRMQQYHTMSNITISYEGEFQKDNITIKIGLYKSLGKSNLEFRKQLVNNHSLIFTSQASFPILAASFLGLSWEAYMQHLKSSPYSTNSQSKSPPLRIKILSCFHEE